MRGDVPFAIAINSHDITSPMTNNGVLMKLKEMFPRRYATGDDLQGKAVTLTILRVAEEKMRPNPGSPPVDRWVLYFDKAKKGVILSRTLAYNVAEALGSEDTNEWIGKAITLYPEPMNVAGKKRTAIRARKADENDITQPNSGSHAISEGGFLEDEYVAGRKMKHEFPISQPSYLVEDWPGKFEVFSWLEYVISVPNPICILTTRKANGASNACLHSWHLLIGNRDNYTSLLAILDGTHTYVNILREGEWCVNYPSVTHYPQCFETVYCNAPENDEVGEAGFTLEPAQTVAAPRIAECLFNLECHLEWHQPLYEGNPWHLFAGRVQHVAVHEIALGTDPGERMHALGLMYNLRGTINPVNGAFFGPNTLALIGQVLKVFTEEGQPTGWRKTSRVA